MSESEKPQTPPKRPGKRISIDIPKELEAVYANVAFISHTPAEVVLDFAQVLPRSNRGKVVSRVIMSPQHAKRMLSALTDNIERFEKSFGNIQVQDGPGNSFPPGFTGPTGIA